MSLMLRVSQSPAVAALAGFWWWWVGELEGIVRALGMRKVAPQDSVRILLEPARVTVERITGDLGERFVDERAFADLDDEALAELAALIAGTRARLCLQAPQIFVTTITLPHAARSRAAAAVALQMMEIAPLRPELLTWAIVDRQPGDTGVTLRIAMAKRAELDAITDRFERLGLERPIICASDAAGDAPFPETGLGSISRIHLRRHAMLVASAILLLSIPLTIWTGSTIMAARARWGAEALTDQVRDIRQARGEAERLEQQRKQLSPLFGQPGAAAVLNDLAKRLPHSDWVESIERNVDGSLKIIIATQDEAAVDEAVRSSPLLPGARVTDRADLEGKAVEVTYLTDAP